MQLFREWQFWCIRCWKRRSGFLQRPAWFYRRILLPDLWLMGTNPHSLKPAIAQFGYNLECRDFNSDGKEILLMLGLLLFMDHYLMIFFHDMDWKLIDIHGLVFPLTYSENFFKQTTNIQHTNLGILPSDWLNFCFLNSTSQFSFRIPDNEHNSLKWRKAVLDD